MQFKGHLRIFFPITITGGVGDGELRSVCLPSWHWRLDLGTFGVRRVDGAHNIT